MSKIAGKPDDTFWQPVKKGVDDARKVVELTGGTVTFMQLANYDNLGPDAANLIRTAVSQGVDGIVIADWVPDAMNYVGSDEYVAGQAAGEYFAGKGLKNGLCVNHVHGSVPLQRRCQGVADAIGPLGGKSTELPLPPARRPISGLPPSTSLAAHSR